MLGVALASLALATPAFADAVLDQASQLLASHQARAAHALLLPLEDERGGQPDYDYLLGLSALESGDPVDAAFAFERCLAVEPRNGPCRVQMARTHLALGEQGNAQHELGIIKQNSPPPDVAQLVSRYLGDLDTSSRQRRRSLGGYVAVGGGYDTNANLATNQAHIAIPLFDNIVLPLSRSGVQRPAGFGQSMAGVAGHYKLGTSWTLLGDADVADRVYFDHGDLNSRNESLNLGGAYQFGASRYSASAQQQDYELHDQLFRRLWGGLLQYQYGLGDISQLSTYAQTNRISYPQDQPYNVDRSTLGAACSLALPGPGTPVMFIGADAGREAVRNADYAYNAQHFVGTRVGATAFVNHSLALDVSVLTEIRHYGADNPVFLLTRKDRQYDISLGLTWKLGYGFSLRPNYAYTHNSSNIVIDSFARTLSSLDLRYEM
jgi:hypothetical protein